MIKNIIIILSLTLARFGPNLVLIFFFFFFFSWVLPLLDFYIVSSYHCTQFQGKPINQTWENGKKPSFGPDLAPWAKIWIQKLFRGFYLYYILDIVASYLCMQFQEKLMNRTWENSQKPSFGPNFGPLTQIRAVNFFFKNLPLSATSYHGQLSSCTISEKLMIQFWENLVTDGRTDESDFIGPCPTNVERPIKKYVLKCLPSATQPLPIFKPLPIKHVWQGSKYASALKKKQASWKYRKILGTVAELKPI